jgi:hypothetical protein
MAFKLPNSSIKAAITKTGYRSDSKDVNNDVNIIPSSRITMKGVEFEVKGVGNNGVTKHMKPGKDYDFGNADYVVETPLKHCGCGVVGPKRFGATGYPGDKKAFGKDKSSPMKKAEPRRTIGRGKNFNKVAKDKSATGGAAGGGMTQRGVNEYKRKNPGSKLKTAVTTKPSKLKPGSKAAKRRKSFCARSKGWTGERGRAARRRWNC